MKILSNEQIREADAYTIENEPIASIDLMERAASQLMREYTSQYTVKNPVEIFAGPGNNGGDGIALARMLVKKGYRVALHLLVSENKLSGDSKINYGRLPESDKLSVYCIDDSISDYTIDPKAVIVDALFGSGLARPLEGKAGRVVEFINTLPNTKIAVDIPSGLFAESNSSNEGSPIINADFTWCFQFPKLAFLMPENEDQVGEWKFLDIGLHPDFISSVNTPYHYLTREDTRARLASRKVFSHKGDFGHALLLAGSSGKLGAAALAGRACLRSGVGLLTIHLPSSGVAVLQTNLPEAMVSIDVEKDRIDSLPDLSPYSAMGMGPGIGMHNNTKLVVEKLLHNKGKIVLDADALNILAENPSLLDSVPPGTILTPHPGEYTRLFGPDKDHYTRLMRLRDIAAERRIVIVLKGAKTAIASPNGELWFNSTGNPGMATAGSGDVLTGIILSLLSQGYDSMDAAILSVFLHGLAGDLAEKKLGQEGLIAGDIIDYLPHAFNTCRSD